jgi:hypothetical protein
MDTQKRSDSNDLRSHNTKWPANTVRCAMIFGNYSA